MPRNKHGNSGLQTSGNAPRQSTAASTPDWLKTELIVVADNGDVYEKMLRAMNADTAVYNKVQYGACHQRRVLIQQRHDKVMGGRKSEKAKEKDKGKAATRNTKVDGKGPKITGDDFATATRASRTSVLSKALQKSMEKCWRLSRNGSSRSRSSRRARVI